MIGKTNLGGSGGGLNFKVVGGTARPTGKENLVWVKTATPITSWEVSPSQPVTPLAGMVWIQNGNQNEINVLKKNVLNVFPTSCKVFTAGKWANVAAYLYKNSQWVQFSYDRYYLYHEGDEQLDITNGWALSTTGTRTHGDKLIKNATSMEFFSQSASGKNYACGFLRAKNKISLANFKFLKIEFASVTNAYRQSAAVATTLDKYDLCDYQSSINAQTAITVGMTEVAVNISALSGSYYVGACAGLDGTTRMIIKNIWLE